MNAANTPRPRPPAAPRPAPADDSPGPRFDATMAERAPGDLPWLDATHAETPGPRHATFQLVRTVDGFPVARHVFAQGLVRVGRGDECDLELEDVRVSRYHALIERRAEGFVLHDQLSSNGVTRNGRKVEGCCELLDGDVLVLGTTRLTFQTEPDQRPGAAPLGLALDDEDARPIQRPRGPAAEGPVAARTGAATTVRTLPTPGVPPSEPPAPTPGAGGAAAPARARDVTAGAGPPVAAGRAPAALAVEEQANRTFGVGRRRADEEQREAGVPVRAYLRALEEQRWSASHLARASAQHVIARDAFLIGGGEDADLRLGGLLTPRVVAAIVRGPAGFLVTQVTGWPWGTRVNGRVVVDREPLEDGDVLVVAGARLSFHRGSPPV